MDTTTVVSYCKKYPLVINLATISLNDSLQQPLEHIDNVFLFHDPPQLVNGGLQGINIRVADFAGFLLNLPPNEVIHWIQIWALRGPKVLGPELHVVIQLLLYNICSMGRSSGLLKYIRCLDGLLHRLGDLWDNIYLQHHKVGGCR
uniref:Uncharacterized protein n=1 Tax=Lepeophtheirus salmonis TaxID=72036 RepID=A0A0K2U1L4_LEPSM